MDRETAIDNILRNYGKLANLDRPQLEALLESADRYGLTVRAAYNGLRLCYGIHYGQQEYFTAAEAAEMAGTSVAEFLDILESEGIPVEKRTGTTYYFPQGL